MFAIAVDRYICIVRPLKHTTTMTLKRAKVLVAFLLLLAITLGLLCCLIYGTNSKEVTCVKTYFTQDRKSSNETSRYRKVADPVKCNASLEVVSFETVNNGYCSHNNII